jgi:drug/metabolite transporter (DMT)-like permease
VSSQPPAESAPPALTDIPTRSHALRGRALVFAATVLWGTTAVLARFVFHRRQVPVLTVVELRLGIATMVLAGYLALRRPERLKIEWRDAGYFIVLGIFGVAAVQGSYYRSIAVFGVGLAILIQYLAPVLIVIFDALRGRRVPPAMWLAVAAATAGTALVIGDIDPSARHARPIDWAIGFSSALAFSFYIVFSKRGLRRYAPETVLVYTFAIAALLWAFVTPPWKIVGAHYGAELWGMFLALGLFSTLVPFSLFYSGLRHLPAAEAGIVATLEPVVAVLAAAAFLGEWLRPLQWLGAALVLGAAATSSIRAPEVVAAHAERG